MILHNDEVILVLTSGGIESITVTTNQEYSVSAVQNMSNSRLILINRDKFFQSLKEDLL